MFVRFLIPLPRGVRLFRYGSARDLVAKVGDAISDQDFVRHLLWVNERRIARTGLSPFRFTSSGRGSGLEVIALGTSAASDLLVKGHLLSQAISQYFHQVHLLGKRAVGGCVIEPSPWLIRYYIYRMIIQKYHYEQTFKLEEKAHRNGTPSQVLLSHVKQLIERDLLRQAEIMLVDVPADLTVVNVGLADLKPHKVVEHRSNLSAQVGFTLNYVLKGPWAVGHLASRGFGAITQNSLPLFRNESA